MGLFKPYRRVLSLGRHLLVENVFDIVRSIGLVKGGALHGVEQGLRAVFIFKSQELFDAGFEGLVGGGEMFEIALGDLAQGNEGGNLLGVPVPAVALLRRFSVLRQFDALFAPPGAQVGGDGLLLKIAGDLVVVGFDGDGFANEPRRHGVGVAIKANGEIGVDLG